MAAQVIASVWWVLVLRGILGILFGILALLAPFATFQAVILVVGAFALVDGVFSVISAIRGRTDNSRWVWDLIGGIISIVFGLLALFDPLAMGAAIVLLVGAWAIVSGIVQIISAILLRRVIENEIWLALGGVLSIIFGVLVFLFPVIMTLAAIWVFGVYAIVFGVLFIVLGIRLRGLGRGGAQPTPAAT
ncbi:MAG: hypothetical protein KatS3mg060_1898 [Dehalococcoidia bacterium]|nr:MAG: hypothetical protein KatS3mg060_1898 [Dehalococcoidia bacterium]